jgi:hypothetical protein
VPFFKDIRKGATDMKRQTDIPRRLAVAVALFTLGTAPLASLANDTFDEGEIFFELNNTDGDLGIHARIDGDAWGKLKISDPDGKEMLDIKVKSILKQQGLTELFFESAEPPFESDDPEEVALTPEEFFERFPEGDYQISGRTLEGDDLSNETGVTHVMPGPPEAMVNDMVAAEDCDAVLPVVKAGDPVTIYWETVTHSHPDLGISGVLIDVVNYEVVVEIDETPFKTSTILPPSATSFEVPGEILALNDKVKFEVLVREASYNQTAVESCFCIGACPTD